MLAMAVLLSGVATANGVASVSANVGERYMGENACSLMRLGARD